MAHSQRAAAAVTRRPAADLPEVSAGGFPGVIGPTRVIETHTAILFFVGDLVYKAKKPVDLGFLDFRDPQARKAACQAEVELNRRLAPDVYLGTAEVTLPGQSPEPMVVMRRMPEERRLSTMVSTTWALSPVQSALHTLGRRIAAFHARCATSDAIAAAADPQALRALWHGNLDVLYRYAGQVLTEPTVQMIERLAFEYLDGRLPLLRARQRGGFIRDGHGDLLADDIFVLDDGPRVLDCIEFDPQLRYCDVLADVAFLAMDLERLGAATAARFFLDTYGEFSAEHHPRSLEDWYIAYRAGVRSKVSCLRWAQGDKSAAPAARNFAEIAVRHLRRARIRLVLVGGVPGSGKSTLATALSDSEGTDWTLLRSDVIRKELAGLTPGDSARAPFGQGLYSAEQTRRTYEELFTRARHALELGESVIIDASFSRAEDRVAAARLAKAAHAPLIELRCQAPPAVVAARLASRDGQHPHEHHASDADLAIATAMAAEADPWPWATPVDTSAPVPAVVRSAQAIVNADAH